jgi:hypothetical protein
MILLAMSLPALAVDVGTFAPSGAPLSGGAGLQNVDARVADPLTWTAGAVLGWASLPVWRGHTEIRPAFGHPGVLLTIRATRLIPRSRSAFITLITSS